MPGILIIQTSFPGDVILATALVEKLGEAHPDTAVDFLLRKGNETLLQNNPHIREVMIWDKKNRKIRNLFMLAIKIRRKKYDAVINVHRFASSGILSAISGAPVRTGFNKNPLSFFYTKRIKHVIGDGRHETERNQELLIPLAPGIPALPKIYPSDADFRFVASFTSNPYICIAPGSVWFTKTFPSEKWTDFIAEYIRRNPENDVFLIGGREDAPLADKIMARTGNSRVINQCGNLTFLQSGALMKGARMNFVNDSSPLHLCSALDAPVTAVFCSTIPAFGFGPLSTISRIVEIPEDLYCRPCGIHGFKQCPEGHFRCALSISLKQFFES